MKKERSEIINLLRLNDEQQKVLGLEETTVVRAGAGAGKTTTLVASLLYDLLVLEIPAREIAVATFTRAAAAGLRARSEEALYRLLGPESPGIGDIWLGTIDALALRYLDTFSLRLGLGGNISPGRARDLNVLGRKALAKALEDSSERAEDLLRALGGEDSLLLAFERLERRMNNQGVDNFSVYAGPRENKEELLLALEELSLSDIGEKSYQAVINDMAAIEAGLPDRVSRSKWHIRKDGELFQKALSLRDAWLLGEMDNKILPLLEGAEELFYSWQDKYSRLRNKHGTFSYEDIIAMAKKIAKPVWQKTYIDEAQDTSLPQRQLMKELTAGVMIFIGDKNQSIYNFRGANAQLWEEESRGLPLLTLHDNYRSGQEILKTVESLCRPLLASDLVKMRGHEKGGQVTLCLNRIPKGVEGELAEIEARTLLPHVLEKIEDEGYNLSDVAILLPSNQDIFHYSKVLRKLQVPCVALLAKGLLLEEECQDLKAALAWLAREDDEGALVRLLSSPFFGWSKSDLMSLSLSKKEKESGQEMRKLLPDDIKEQLNSWRALLGTSAPSQIIRQMILDSSFDLALSLLDATGLKSDNIEGFFLILESIEMEEGWNASRVLQVLEQEEEADDQGQENRLPEGLEAIRLLTIHRAKGDEFPVVICGRISRQGPRVSDKFLLDGRDLGFSLSKDMKNRAMIEAEAREKALLLEENNRLFYVALTRAKERLFILASSWRKGLGFSGAIEKSGVLKSNFPRTEFVAENEDEKTDEEISLVSAALAPDPYHSFSHKTLLETLSWSKLASFDQCSLRRDLETMALPRAHIDFSGQGARQLGEEIHRALALDIKRGSISSLAYPPQAREMIEKMRLDIWPEIEAYSSDQEREVEVPFLFSLRGTPLRGRIDLLLKDSPRAWVIDWKSGEDDHFEKHYLLQRKIYALALLSGDFSEVRATTYYLRKGAREEEVYVDRDLLEKEVLAIIKEIFSRPAKNSTSEPKAFCLGCPGLLQICPVSQAVEKNHER